MNFGFRLRFSAYHLNPISCKFLEDNYAKHIFVKAHPNYRVLI